MEGRSDFASDRHDGEIGTRLAVVVKRAGGNKVVATKSGVPLRTLARLLAGQEPKVEHLVRLADTCGVSLDWLATGKGGVGGEPASLSAIDARQKAIKAALDDENAPITTERMSARPELAEIRRELEEMAHRPDLSDSQRGFAGLVLRLAFDDASAAHRGRLRDERLHAQLRASGATFKKAVDVVGWEPPPAFGQALKTLIFRYEISVEDAVAALDALKYGYRQDDQ